MRPSAAHKALCALLAIALLALPALATAARVVPGANHDQVHQRALKTYTYNGDEVIGLIPCYSTPSGITVSAEVEVAVGALIGYIPICRGSSTSLLGVVSLGANIYLGGLISIVDGLLGSPVLPGTHVLPPALGVAVSVGVGIALGKFIPCYGSGAPSSSLLPAALGVGLDIDLDLVIGALNSIAPLAIDVDVGLGVGAAIGGALTVGKPAIGVDLGIVSVDVQLGDILGCLPYITAPTSSAAAALVDVDICLGAVAPWGSATSPAPAQKPIVPSSLVVAGIEAKVLIGYFPIFLHPHTGTTPALGLLDLVLGVGIGVGIDVGATKCSVSGSPIAYLPVYGPRCIAH